MKLLSTNICLSSPKSILVISVILFSSIVLAGVWPEKVIEVDSQEEPWVPTEADIAYQDSITDIKKDIVYILERLDYEDGTYDSIRYVKGGKIDLRRN